MSEVTQTGVEVARWTLVSIHIVICKAISSQAYHSHHPNAPTSTKNVTSPRYRIITSPHQFLAVVHSNSLRRKRVTIRDVIYSNVVIIIFIVILLCDHSQRPQSLHFATLIIAVVTRAVGHAATIVGQLASGSAGDNSPALHVKWKKNRYAYLHTDFYFKSGDDSGVSCA